jgi:hypothetical protein
MMRRFFENKIAAATVVSLFSLASGLNMLSGISHSSLRPTNFGPVNVAHGPLLPPDPWETNVQLAHGPLLPPDPWETNVQLAHGPLLPPDPWETVAGVRVGHGPLLPPDPWETVAGVRVGHGPLLPPDPWETSLVTA